MNDLPSYDVYYSMSAVRPHVPQPITDWKATIRLGVVFSIAAVCAVLLLADRVGDTAVILGVMVAATIAAWTRPAPSPQAIPVRVRHHVGRR